jgi:hypothetical protein
LPQIDLALLPFWYVLSEKSRAFVKSSIAPDEIIGIHLPPQDAAEVEQRLRDAGVKVSLLVKPGTQVR